MSKSQHAVLRWGVIGLGRAFMLMLPAFRGDPRFRLLAAADPRPDARAQFERDFGVQAFADAAAVCAHPDVDAIYVASPHAEHERHVVLAAQHRKHVMVEKPMAISLDACSRMIEACERSQVVLMVGHSHGLDAPIDRCQELIQTKRFGEVRMVTALNFTDFMFRPRARAELDPALGGGVVLNQGAHQVDIARRLCGGLVEQVDAWTGSWDLMRKGEGAYTALLRFRSGAVANLTYSGYAHFNSDLWMDGVGELGRPVPPGKHHQTRGRLLAAIASDSEQDLKAHRLYGGAPAPTAALGLAGGHQHFGPLIISCEKADIRPSPLGLHIDADDGYYFEPMSPPVVERQEVFDAFLRGMEQTPTSLHNGRWGRATVAVCEAIARSAEQRCSVRPLLQTA